jgi:hypothetical protein
MTRVEKQGGPVSRRQEYDAPLFNPDFGNDYFVHCMKLSTSHWTIFNRHQWILELLLNQSIFLSIPDPQRLGVIQHVQLPPPPSKWHNATAIQDMIHTTPTLLLTRITHSISPMAKDQLPESTWPMTFLLEVSLHQLWSLLWELISAGASIQNLQFGWAGSSEYMTTGIIAVGFGEAIAGYPCLIDQMALQGIIHSRAFSLDLGGVDTQSGMSTASVVTRQQTFSTISASF